MKMRRSLAVLLVLMLIAGVFAGCGGAGSSKRIVRIGHNQSTAHPSHIALEAFADYINNSELGEKYEVQVYPSELLGSQNEMVQLTQTGAIDFVIASNAIMETFSKNYSIFNLPYLFSSAEAYHAAMNDASLTDPIFLATEDAGFRTVTWLDAGTRNFYTVDKPIEKPEDLKGLKIRVQQSPTNIAMMNAFGGSATPMGFGEVYTALQSNIIDGAENNEMALTDNGHGDVCKYYSYDMHQMVPDLLLGNVAFLNGLPEEEYAIFEEGFKLINTVQREEWTKAVENAKNKAQNEQGVQFYYPDTAPFQEACMPIHDSVVKGNAVLEEIYAKIQAYNAQFRVAAE